MENQELSVEETEAFLQTVNKLLEEFRKIKSSQENSDHLVQLLDKLDEYLTVVTAFCLRDLSEVCIGEPRNKILSFWQEVEKYRASRFPVESIEGESKESAFLMRWSFLKKFVQSSLFLDIPYKQGARCSLTYAFYLRISSGTFDAFCDGGGILLSRQIRIFEPEFVLRSSDCLYIQRPF